MYRKEEVSRKEWRNNVTERRVGECKGKKRCQGKYGGRVRRKEKVSRNEGRESVKERKSVKQRRGRV